MATRDEIRAVKEQVESDLLKIPGVTGVDIGYKIVDGEKINVLALLVYVVSKDEIPEGEVIPTEVMGIPTDVIERRFILHGGGTDRPS